jgi:hypothetical protein
VSASSIVAKRTGLTTGRVLHQARVGAFYGLSGLLTLFLSFELFAHLLLPTPVLTNWAGGHHVHALSHFVLTAVLLGAVGSGVHPRTRRIAGLQGLLLVPALGLVVSVIAWQGLHSFSFPVFNFALYGAVALALAVLHPDRGRLLTAGRVEPKLAVMAVLTLVPLLAYATGQVLQQLSNAEPVHAVPGHFALSAALAIGVAGLAGLAALRTDGWRLPLWSSGLALVALGIGSAALPYEASSFGLVGGLAATAWGAAFIWLGNRFGSGREDLLWSPGT